jgi:hypothetical protein
VRIPFLSIALMLALAGCAAQVPPSAPDTALVATQMTFWRCREFTVQVTVEGQQQQAVGQACQQPDGSWQVTLSTPGLPQQVYTLPPQAINAYPYPEPAPYLESAYWWDPWFYGPWFVGRPVFLARGFHHHHDFQHNGGSHKAARGLRGGRR